MFVDEKNYPKKTMQLAAINATIKYGGKYPRNFRENTIT
jgi:hypothetical protein